MKTKLGKLLVAWLGAWCLVSTAQDAAAVADPSKAAAKPAEAAVEPAASATASPAGADEVSPLVTYPDTPLRDVIQNLARQAGVNFQFDPSVSSLIASNNVSIRFENVTAMQALEAVLANNGLLLQPDPKTKIARIISKPTQEPAITLVMRLKYAHPTNIAQVITGGMGTTVKVFPDPRTSQLVITATESQFAQLTNMIAKLDTPVKQVLIEANFIETTKNPTSVKGIDWSGTLQAQNFSFGNGNTAVESTTTTPGSSSTTTLPSGRTITTTTPAGVASTATTTLGGSPTSVAGLSATAAKGFMPATAFLNADGVKAALSFLNTDADTESVATPRAVTMEGLETELSVVRNIPIFEEQQGQLGGVGNQLPNTVKPNYNLTVGQTVLNEVGVKLIVTPRIIGDTNIALTLKPEISIVEVIPERKTLGGRINESPIFARRKLYTQATVPNGSTLVLGGLLNDDTQKNFTKVPLLGDIPVLGLLFRKDSKSRNKRNLLIFVTPTIVEDTDFTPKDSTKNFLKTSTEIKTAPEENAWEGGKPYDWSKQPGR